MREGISVSELNTLIAESLRREPRLRNVSVTGEISGFKHHLASGHWYFALKDRDAAISCVMFRQNTFHASLRPKDGDQVTVTGYVEIYPRDGKVQLYAMGMKAAGIGSLWEQFEALKQKLQAEGLFDSGRKRLLPQIPRKVAVITSGSGAALHDILNVSGMRNPAIPIVVIPSSVQGPDAPKELIRALRRVTEIPEVDAVIIGRGGGSAEDLWCFNDEGLARAVAACPVPVVSGVGHEVDFTICDYVADVRASTPSNAAEIVFPDRNELRGRVRLMRTGLDRAMNSRISGAMLRVHEAREKLQRMSPEQHLHDLTDRAHRSRQTLERCMALRIREEEENARQVRARMSFAMDRMIQSREFQIRQARTRLEAISPLKVLDRGYALVYDTDGKVLPDAESAKGQKKIRIRFRDGEVEALGKEQA